jgi:hypothetical protein
MDEDQGYGPVYVGQCRSLRYWPRCMLVLALVPCALGNLGPALLFIVPALLVSLWIPWRFLVYTHGIELWFGFGKRRFLERENVTVRANLGGAVVLPRGAQRFGYPLTNGLVERDRVALRTAFALNGFDLAD